jgi:solute carrier family 25 citrate transporter 1
MAPTGNKPKHAGKAIVAGGVSGAIEICCTYPLEFTKTVSQLDKGGGGAMGVIRNTMKTSGPLGFYRGLSSMVYFATPKAAIRFSAFEQASNMLQKDGKPMFGAATSFVAGLCAGTAEAIVVTTPQETIKIKLIDDAFKRDVPRFNGFFHGVSTIIKEEGFAGVYAGLAPTILKVATAQGTRFGVFHYIPAEYRKGPLGAAASGAFAGGVSVLIFQGIDVIKSRMQGLEGSKYTSSMHCLRDLVQNEGVLALYKGVGPRLSRVCCEVAITMSLYAEVVKLLNKYWITPDQIEAQKKQEMTLIHSSSVVTEVPKPK